MIVVYFDQLSGACNTWKLVELLFFSRFQPFLFIILNLFHWFQHQFQSFYEQMPQAWVWAHHIYIISSSADLLSTVLWV